MVAWNDVYPFEIDLHRIPNFTWLYDTAIKYHVDWDNYKLGFKTEEDKVKFILRWM